MGNNRMSDEQKNALSWFWKVIMALAAFLAAYNFNQMSEEIKLVRHFMQAYPAETNVRLRSVEKDTEQLRRDVDRIEAEKKAMMWEYKQHTRNTPAE